MRLRLYDRNNDFRKIESVVSLLKDGGVMIYPTGTTYALGCHALKERAVERICRIKGIDPARHPLSIVCYDMSAISQYAKIDTTVYKMMKRNLPGDFTFILPGLNSLPKVFRNRKGHEVGIRMPDSAIVREILQYLDAPLMTASMPVGEDEPEYLTDPELAEERFGGMVDLVVYGGVGVLSQSTIVDCTGDVPEVTRQGAGVLV